jgi:hypothetical protein
MQLSTFKGKEGATYVSEPNPWPLKGCDAELGIVEGIRKHGTKDSRCCR